MQIFKISDDFIKYYNSNPCIKKVYLKYDIWADSWNDEQQETYKECLELDKERKVVIMKSE